MTALMKDLIEQWADLFTHPSSLTEIRYTDGPGMSSYYSQDKSDLVDRAMSLSSSGANVYFTLNPIRAKPKKGGTSDSDVLEYRWFPIDIDTKREKRQTSSGYEAKPPASEAEVEEAKETAEQVREHLRSLGWPEPVVGFSGNGIHLLYGLTLSTGDANLLRGAIRALAAKFNTETIDIDKSVWNPARIWRLYGTANRKGEEYPQEQRFFRTSRLLEVPDEIIPIGAAHLTSLCPGLGETENARYFKAQTISAVKLQDRQRRNDEMVAAANDLGWRVMLPEPYGDGRKWICETCPMDQSHEQNLGSTALLEDEFGVLRFKCFHDRCSHWDIWDARDKLANSIDLHPRVSSSTHEWRKNYFSSREDCGKPRVFKRDVDQERLARETIMHLERTLELFSCDGKVVTVRIDPEFGPVRELLGVEEFGAVAKLHVSFVSIVDTKTGKKLKHVEMGRPLTTLVYSLSRNNLPYLRSTVNSPTFAPDGRLICEPGYDVKTGIYFHPHPTIEGCKWEPTNTHDAAMESVQMLLAPFRFFPWAGLADKIHFLASILQQFIIEYLDHICPAYLFDAKYPGSGKSLLASSSAMIGQGVTTMFSEPKDKNELKKRIDSALIRGDRTIIVDNVTSKLNNDDLLRDITSEWFEPRVLGKSEVLKFRNVFTYMFTANNTDLCVDMARRTIPILLTPSDESAARRKLPPEADNKLLHTLKKERARFVGYALNIINGWMAAGSPCSPHSMPSFEPWASSMGGLMYWLCDAYGDAFLSTYEHHIDNVDKDRMWWLDTVDILLKGLGYETCINGFTARQAYRVLDDAEHLPLEVRDYGGNSPSAQNQSLCKWLSKREGPVNGKHFIYVKTSGHRPNKFRFEGIDRSDCVSDEPYQGSAGEAMSLL